MIKPVSAHGLSKTEIFAEKVSAISVSTSAKRESRDENERVKSRDFRPTSCVPLGAWPSAGMAGWRRSVDRASLQPDSLLTGNFTGKFAILVVQRPVQRPENATPQSWWLISDLDERSGDSAGRSFVQAQLALIRWPGVKSQSTALAPLHM